MVRKQINEQPHRDRLSKGAEAKKAAESMMTVYRTNKNGGSEDDFQKQIEAPPHKELLLKAAR